MMRKIYHATAGVALLSLVGFACAASSPSTTEQAVLSSEGLGFMAGMAAAARPQGAPASSAILASENALALIPGVAPEGSAANPLEPAAHPVSDTPLVQSETREMSLAEAKYLLETPEGKQTWRVIAVHAAPGKVDAETRKFSYQHHVRILNSSLYTKSTVVLTSVKTTVKARHR